MAVGGQTQEHRERDHDAEVADETDEREALIVDRHVEPELAPQLGGVRQRRAELGGDQEETGGA
ncbi:MAG: hypothetical protein R3F54_26240 [Alphaproteobacteria bacterium]